MYCYHCGKEINERKVEAKESTLVKENAAFKEGTEVSYVCPRCGHLIHSSNDEVDITSLARASHAEIQRGRNSFARGMGALCIGLICLILALLFLRLSFKPGMQNQLILTCPEFFVSMALFALAGFGIIYGTIFVILGLIKIKKYDHLLLDIHNRTFYQ
jgi:hypothetical protein